MATKKYFGEETRATRKRKTTARKTSKRRVTKRTARRTNARAITAHPATVMIAVPAHLAFQIGLSIGRQLTTA